MSIRFDYFCFVSTSFQSFVCFGTKTSVFGLVSSILNTCLDTLFNHLFQLKNSYCSFILPYFKYWNLFIYKSVTISLKLEQILATWCVYFLFASMALGSFLCFGTKTSAFGLVFSILNACLDSLSIRLIQLHNIGCWICCPDIEYCNLYICFGIRTTS